MKSRLFLTFLFFTFFTVLYDLNYKHHDFYEEKLKEKMNHIVLGSNAPRGKILDRNGKVLVDNEGILNIVYHKTSSVTTEEELAIAKKLSAYVTTFSLTDANLKNYYLITHENGKDLITKEEWTLWEERKLNNEDIAKMKWERVPIESLDYQEEEQKLIFIYSKMQEGYLYQDKIIFKDVSDDFVASISNLNILSISVSVASKRVYPYQDTLRSIFGGIGNIPKEEMTYFMEMNYSLSDTVGISGLEKEYETLLRGEKAKYYINSDNSLTLIEEEKKGKDLVLNIDIDIQLELERVMKEEMKLAREKKSAKYFHEAYAMIGDPKTGGILALTGLKILDNNEFSDITITAFTSAYAMGSVVKAASNTVGYLSGAIEVGKKVYDSCVKLWSEPSKCSYTRLGNVDDITALRTSSNYYQFVTAIKSTGQVYQYNMKFNVTEDDFLRYRNIFASYGLGEKTEIDYPIEQTGMKGNKVSGDLLLNYAIGQYDTYTPISLLQYINTISNYGNRYALRFKKEEFNTFLNQVELDSSYYDRITEGLYQVFHGGTASSYVNKKLDAVGKTGTSETFYDSDNDGVVDKEVINSTVVFYYPRENPTYSMAVVAPYLTDVTNYTYPFTQNVSLKMTNYLPF